MVPYLVIGMTYAFAAAVQPGPFQSYLISQSLSKGWQSTISASFAPLLSDGPIIVLVIFLLTQIPAELVILLQFLGGFFLLYLAGKAWKNWESYNSNDTDPAHSDQRTLIQATFVNLLNPAPYLTWSLVLGPILLKGWHENPRNGIAMLISFYTVMVIISMCIIILFASAKKFGPVVTRALIGISAIALCCFGIYQLWSGASFFWNLAH